MSTNAQPAGAPGEGKITRLVEAMREGNPKSEEGLFSRVYHELRTLAAAMLAREAPSQTSQPTALVNEAWLRLFGRDRPHYPDRACFFAALGKAMRRVLVEKARRRKRLKRGGNLERLDIEGLELAVPFPDDEVLAVDEALDRLAESDPRAAELVNLCYFVGLTQKEAAKELGVSVATIERTWAFARAWLFRELERSRNPPA
jgi:RNA polymerase sigma factor (TIGR02999 family)